jgi:hypothetical protein
VCLQKDILSGSNATAMHTYLVHSVKGRVAQHNQSLEAVDIRSGICSKSLRRSCRAILSLLTHSTVPTVRVHTRLGAVELLTYWSVPYEVTVFLFRSLRPEIPGSKGGHSRASET